MSEPAPRSRASLRNIAAGVAGLAAVAALVHLAKAGMVIAEMHRALVFLPFVVALEGASLSCETFALWRLYGESRGNLSLRSMAHAGLVGYAPTVLMPAGRAVAEAIRAGLLSRSTSGALAAAVAVQMQAVLLISISFTSLVCAVATCARGGPSWLPLAMVVNGLVTGALAAAMVAIARRSRVGAWLSNRWHRLRRGAEFDEVLRTRPALPVSSLVAACAGRLCQVAELGVLLAAVDGHTGPLRALAAEGVHLIGASLGDLIPAQLGASDAAFAFSAGSLGLQSSAALAISLLAHATQAIWCVIGTIVPFAALARRRARPISMQAAPP